MSGEADAVAHLRAKLRVRERARERAHGSEAEELDVEIAEIEATIDEHLIALRLASG